MLQNTLVARFFAIVIVLVSGASHYVAFTFQNWMAIPFLTLVPALWTHLWIPLFHEVDEKKYLRFYEYTVLIFGPFALFGSIIILLLPGKKYIAEEFREYLAAEMVFSPSERLEFGLTLNYWEGETHKKIAPFVDIMRGENAQMKRSTIDKVIQHPDKNSRKILNLGLTGDDQDIRFYAASGLILLNDTFMKSFKEMHQRIKKEPDNSDHFLELAKLYDRYCYLELPEKEDLQKNYLRIEGYYRKSLELVPDNERALIGLGRALIKTDRAVEAMQPLGRAVKLYGKSSPAFAWYLESLFKQKNFTKVRQLSLACHLPKRKTPNKFWNTLLYWNNYDSSLSSQQTNKS